ncbi:protein EDS1L-like [Impatiens glandulifera]|uniref:protein EDS1L-like n=1 Tax=Impatiens glandulifera TaxID=253017 RepID=UPI001FB11B54|nr:protein EDS1L-like [Impatiens glandulifera]
MIRLGEKMEVVSVNLIVKACSHATKAHKFPGKSYLTHKISGSPSDVIVFTFPGSWHVNDWFHHKQFGQVEINTDLFPSLKSLIPNQPAPLLNEAFLQKFHQLLLNTSFEKEVGKAKREKNRVIFAGHSSGGPMAILATLWFLEKFENCQTSPPLCMTFGSPLIGDKILKYAVNRENWARFFLHVVLRYDIVPRIMLTPLSSIEQDLAKLLLYFNNPKEQSSQTESVAESLFVNVMKNVSCVANHSACSLMECTNPLLQNFTNFIDISPYRPFGTYIFCTGNGKLIAVNNPDAVLQLLFSCAQLTNEAEFSDVAVKSMKQNLGYEDELKESLEMQNLVILDDHLEDQDNSPALNDLGLDTRARLCLRAAAALEKRKEENQKRVDSYKNKISEKLNHIKDYQTESEARKVGYYDAFKLQNEERDFQVNVARLELAGIWDEIIEMLKREELPDAFESRKDWIELGTSFRRLVEPLDIANYYRHLMNEDTGPYLITGRPTRYKYTQRWRENVEKEEKPCESSESCLWAEVEEMKMRPYEEIKNQIQSMERNLLHWIDKGMIGRDVFLEQSTFSKWWKPLYQNHRWETCLQHYI